MPRAARLNAMRFTPLSLILLVAAGCTQTGSLRVIELNQGCEGDIPSSPDTEWERNGAYFFCGDRKVPAGVVDRILELARGDSVDPEFDLELTEERRSAVAHAIQGEETWYMAVGSDLESAPTTEHVEKAVKMALIDEGTDTHHTSFILTLPGLTLRTHSSQPYMQPWIVEFDGEAERTIVNIELTGLAMLFSSPRSSFRIYGEGAGYWQARFWSDWFVWSQVIGDAWREQAARALCASLDGWAAVEKDWDLIDADVGDINGHPTSLQPDLRSKDGKRTIRWWNPLDEDEQPTLDWTDFLEAVKSAIDEETDIVGTRVLD
jgi:hypothetical protein